MAECSFFDLALMTVIRKENLKKFDQQLKTKKNHLAIAQEKYVISVELLKQIQQNLADKFRQLRETQIQINLCADDSKKMKLHQQREAIEQLITQYKSQVDPYIPRLAKLEQRIKKLTAEINKWD